jgi:thiosulfate reductase cytochrome b subunit
MTVSRPTKSKRRSQPHQTLLVKTFHWVNLISLMVMIASGLQIYNANPVFGGRGAWTFPSVFLLGGWLAGGRNWHFAAMWFFSLNLLAYGLYIFITRRWKHRFTGADDLQVLKVGQNPKRKNYAWHRLIYTAIIPILLLAIISGLSMYKPAQFAWMSGLFGSWQTLRVVHFVTVPVVVIFTLVHSFMGLKVGSVRLLKSMFL